MQKTKPRWRSGPPTEPGWWLVEESNGDMVAWLVAWDKDDSKDGERTQRYLRFWDTMNSEPLAEYHAQWPIRRSYGPIPKYRVRVHA